MRHDSKLEKGPNPIFADDDRGAEGAQAELMQIDQACVRLAYWIACWPGATQGHGGI